jgi:hypothetical protein
MPDIYNITDLLRQGPSVKDPTNEYSFGDIFQAELGNVIDLYTSQSRFVNSGAYRERDERINQLAGEQKIPAWILNTTKRENTWGQWEYDMGAAARIISEKFPEFGIQTDEQIKSQIRDDLKMRTEYVEKTRQNRTVPQTVVGFGGSMVGYASDVASVPTYFFGVGAVSRGVSAIRAIGAGALRGGAVELAAETVIQPQVYSWNKDMGVHYSTSDALINMGMATTMGATIGGFSRGLAQFLDTRKVKMTALQKRQAQSHMDALKEQIGVYEDAVELLGDDVSLESFEKGVLDRMQKEQLNEPTPHAEVDPTVKDEEIEEIFNTTDGIEDVEIATGKYVRDEDGVEVPEMVSGLKIVQETRKDVEMLTELKRYLKTCSAV